MIKLASLRSYSLSGTLYLDRFDTSTLAKSLARQFIFTTIRPNSVDSAWSMKTVGDMSALQTALYLIKTTGKMT